jgi:DNA mismatch endonuclease (patch repair protein)
VEAVKSKDTTPEMIVRRMVHAMGIRYRLHVRLLPGTPDLVFPRLGKVIEVRGCFWHGHTCGRCRIPVTRRGYWMAKIERNRKRDLKTVRTLGRNGWRVLVVWECQTFQVAGLSRALKRFLSASKKTAKRSALRKPAPNAQRA